MQHDQEYKEYVNTKDKLLQELHEIRLKLSQKMRSLPPVEQVKMMHKLAKGVVK